MEIHLTKDELFAAIDNAHDDHGLMVLDVPERSCIPRLSVQGCCVFYHNASVRLKAIDVIIVTLVLNGPKTFQEILDSTFIRSDKTLQNHIYSINTAFLEAGIPFSLCGKDGRVEIVSDI